MRIAMFYHSLRSCWNHGNAHFLRGVVSELVARGHRVEVFEPSDAWSVQNLVRQAGETAATAYREAYPQLDSSLYDLRELDLDRVLDGVDLVLVHEWNDPALVARVGRHRRTAGYRLLFHDTHHRAVTAPHEMAAMDLRDYDGVLAFGDIVRRTWLERGWASRAWTWHEAADTRVFRPRVAERLADLVWVGNWGDDERTAELAHFLFEPTRALALSGSVFGVRYPAEGRAAVEDAGLRYSGWLPNHRVPEVFAAHRVTMHVPRRPYAEQLRGIPTIRVFEALACGIPLVSAPWSDDERLFDPGSDYLVARDGSEMRSHLRAVLGDPDLAAALAESGRRTIMARHTCAHRVDDLLGILGDLASSSTHREPRAVAGGDT